MYIRQRYTDKVYLHKWNNNFSEMRNISIGYAKGDWILTIDADEELADTEPVICFLMSDECKLFGYAAFTIKNIVDRNAECGYILSFSPRLFRNDGHFKFEGTVHNMPVLSGIGVKLPNKSLSSILA